MKKIVENDSSEKKPGGSVSDFVGSIGKKVASVSAKANAAIMKVADQNGDGKIDLEDIGIEPENIAQAKEKAEKIAKKTGDSVKKGSEQVANAINEAMLDLDRKSLRPVFYEELLPIVNDSKTAALSLPQMIRIVDRDKKRSLKEVCQGEIGYLTTVKGMDILNIYEESARSSGIHFYPNISKTIYYTDPFQVNCYISLDEYFVFLKKARVSELMMIAKDLGAKKVKISLKEHEKTFVSKNAKGSAKASKGNASASESGEYDRADSNIADVSIADEGEFSGHNIPVQPKLVYFKNESNILHLIEMRMDAEKQNELKTKTYTFGYSKSSGISEKIAGQIDTVLSQMECSGTASVKSEAQKESRTDFKYHIEF